MSEVQKHTANVFLPGCLGPVRREVVLEDDYDALAAECERLRAEMHDLHTTMMAAAVEIQEHWAAHCDAEGYGPANLMRRLEHGIASQYGYDAETLVRIESQRDAALAELAALKGGQVPAGFQRATILKDCNVRYSADTAPPAQASAWPEVQITGHLDELDAPVWEFINAEARKLGPLTGSIDSYGLSRPNGATPNGGIVVLWNGQKIHAVALAVRDAMNRTQCIRMLAAPTPGASDGTK